MKDALTSAELVQLTGSSKRLPNSYHGPETVKSSVTGSQQARRSRFLITRSSVIAVKDHSPDSSDGVVPYWSSHLDGAQSEVIVPGPHGACELPQTIAELDRILRLNLGLPTASRTTVAQAAR